MGRGESAAQRLTRGTRPARPVAELAAVVVGRVGVGPAAAARPPPRQRDARVRRSSARGTVCSQSRWQAPPITSMSPCARRQHDVVGEAVRPGCGRRPGPSGTAPAEHERPAGAEHDDGDAACRPASAARGRCGSPGSRRRRGTAARATPVQRTAVPRLEVQARSGAAAGRRRRAARRRQPLLGHVALVAQDLGLHATACRRGAGGTARRRRRTNPSTTSTHDSASRSSRRTGARRSIVSVVLAMLRGRRRRGRAVIRSAARRRPRWRRRARTS